MFNFELKRITEVNYGPYTFEPYDVIKRKSIDGFFNVCSKCLYVFDTKKSLELHKERCVTLKDFYFKPIYDQKFPEEEKHKHIGVCMVNLIKNKETLALLGESFIRLKTNYYELEDYDFYILIDMDTKDILGYFSKNKFLDNSISCLCIFPPFLNCGLGTFLIDFSQQPALVTDRGIQYKEKHKLYVPLGPERPLSAAAVAVYRKYWAYKVFGAKNIKEAMDKNNLNEEDVILGLEENGFDFKKWKMTKEPVINKPRRLLNKRLLKK